MTSIMTNSSAIAALATLRQIDSNLESTQAHVSSGLRVQTAADNAAYWSIATTMRSDNAALSTVADALGLGASKVDTAYSGLEATIDILSKIQSKLVTAAEPSVDKDKVQKEITELKNQLITIATSSAFSGENWLNNNSTNAMAVKNMVGSFTRNVDGTVSVQTISFNTADSCLIDKTSQKGQLTKGVGVNQTVGTTTNTTTATYYLLNLTGTGITGTQITISSLTSNDDLDGMTKAVDIMLKSVTDVAGTLGAVKSRIDTQTTFVKALHDTIAKGVGRLVDSDMNEESTRLKALQTQQQLGIQSLTIANGNAQQIMQLFR